MVMKKEIKALWLTALRSGIYKKGEGALNDQQHYCCLGVLCDIYQKQTGEGRWEAADDGTLHFRIGEADERDVLPNDVVDWAELPDRNPYFDEYRAIAEYNDESETTFEDVADIIEANL
jgi:hypothetical protein